MGNISENENNRIFEKEMNIFLLVFILIVIGNVSSLYENALCYIIGIILGFLLSFTIKKIES